MDRRLLLMHQVMLGDRPRLEAYDRALEQAVRPGDVVVDVGAGTLILSLLALRHGAGHVYAIEADPHAVAVAERIADDNGLVGKVTIIQGDARAVSLPEKADLVVSEMMGNLGPEEEMAEILRIVARRNLRAGGRVIPERMTTYLAAVQMDEEGWGVWSDDFWGYSLAAVQEFVPPAAQLHVFSRRPALLSSPVPVVDDRIARQPARPRRTHSIDISTDGSLHAILGYFSATLVPGVSLTNFPGYPGCNWATWVWPLRHTTVIEGDVVGVAIDRPRHVRDATGWRLDCRITRGRRS